MSKTLDLGCGTHLQNPYNTDEAYGVDVRPGLGPNIACADLAVEPIPFESDIFDAVTAFHFIEHIPRVIYIPHRRNSFVELMNEIYRVLKVGGYFMALTPALPDLYGTFEDPTHVNTITEGTFRWYFDDTHLRARMYGFTGRFEMMDQQWVNGALFTQMRKLSL